MKETQITEATIIGYGTVGAATEMALVSCGTRTIRVVDPRVGCDWSEAARSGLWFFVCVPTPVGPSGRMDLGSVYDALEQAAAIPDELFSTPHTIVVRSTVLPGTTDELQRRHQRAAVLHWPEFLTERTHMQDALEPARNVIGYSALYAGLAAQLVASIPRAKWTALMPARDAEMVKCASNAFYATKVSFWNQIYDLCRESGVNYDRVRGAMEHDPFCAPQHLDVHHGGYRGYGGSCLPKDVDALLAAANQHGLDLSVLRAAHDYNGKLRGPQ